MDSDTVPYGDLEGEDILVSVTESGWQTGETFERYLLWFNNYLNTNNVQRPVVLESDGHKTRFSLPVLRFCQQMQINLFILPPHTTVRPGLRLSMTTLRVVTSTLISSMSSNNWINALMLGTRLITRRWMHSSSELCARDSWTRLLQNRCVL